MTVRVLAACSLGGAGHLGPLLPLLEAVRRRGHDVLVAGPASLCQMVAAAGLPFEAGGEPAESDVAPIRERLPIVPRHEATVLGNRELFGRLATRALLPAMEQVCAGWAPHLVLRDPCEYASAVVAARQGIPTAQVAISLADAEWASIRVAAPALEEHRRGLTDDVRQTPYVTRFPASLDPSPFPTTVRVHDRVARPVPSLPKWWDRSDSPLVYMTFGTVLGYMSAARSVYRTALEAAGRVEARVLLTVGNRLDPRALGVVPSNVHVEAWVDQADVLPHAALVVCHGGSGTAFGALASGVPLVLVPMFADQFENSRRIAGAGAGVTVETARPPASGRGVIGPQDASGVAGAVDMVLRDPSFRRHAARIAAEMASTTDVAVAVDDLLDRTAG